MPGKLIDLSRPLQNTENDDPPGLAPQIQYMDHTQTTERMLQFFPGVGRINCRAGKVGQSSWYRSRRTTGRISMPRIISIPQ